MPLPAIYQTDRIEKPEGYIRTLTRIDILHWIHKLYKQHITGVNHDGISSYTLKGYKIEITDYDTGQKVAEKDISALLPGISFNLVFEDLTNQHIKIRFLTPNAYIVVEKVSEL